MQSVVLAGVAVQNVAYHIDQPYTYLVPEHCQSAVAVGSRVLLPFGRGSALRQGIVLSLRGAEPEEDLSVYKEIDALLEEEPLYTPNMIRLGEYMRDHTFCTLFDALKTMVPAGVNVKTKAEYAAAPDWNHGQVLSEEERNVLQYLTKRKGSVRGPVILSKLSLPADSKVLEDMTHKGLLLKTYQQIRNVNDAQVKMLRPAEGISTEEDLKAFPEKLTKKQFDTALQLLQVGPCSVKELCYYAGVTEAVIKTLLNKKVLVSYEKEVFRSPYDVEKKRGPAEPIALSPEQQTAYDGLLRKARNGGGTALLFGVTGSGKTNVYLKLIEEVLQDGKGVIVMVPEISLTPQTLKLFYARFGETVAVFHSALSAGERLDEWKRVRKGMARIVVGTRSAVFAPVEDLGLIIMDEEQEGTYQSDMSPRYHARDIARYRCAETKGLLVLASATPSIQSYASAQAGRYDLFTLTQRYGSAVLPTVKTADMRKELSAGNRSQISRLLQSEIRGALSEGHQAILLMNRRGYNTYAACDSCGEVVSCPNCSISLTYHRASNRLMCHYCGYSVPFTTHCEHCGANDIHYTGHGTQHVEEELSNLFPQARILRMDADTTMQKYAYDEKLSAFRKGEYDIMIGTQMVAKGLDFANVTLVGVLSADNERFNDDYKSMERTFDLITQVVGRAGRGDRPGSAVIQTIDPENEIIRMASRQDYPAFYKSEILMRKAMIYPPYCTLFSVRFKGKNEERVGESAKRFFSMLQEQIRGDGPFAGLKLYALGPMPERVYKVGGNYRVRLLLKARNTKQFRAFLSELLKAFGKDRKNGGVSTTVEIEG